MIYFLNEIVTVQRIGFESCVMVISESQQEVVDFFETMKVNDIIPDCYVFKSKYKFLYFVMKGKIETLMKYGCCDISREKFSNLFKFHTGCDFNFNIMNEIAREK